VRTGSRTVLTPRDAAIGGAFLAASAGLSVFDLRIARNFQDTTLSHARTGRRLADIFTHIHETRLTIAGILAYGAGRLTKSEALTDVAFHATEAIVISSLASQLIRGPLGRERPKAANFESQYRFSPFKGFREFENRAFPSIHTASAFAAATVLTMETKRRAPDKVWLVAPLSYAIASTPALSRMYLGQHWASDILMGGFMGVFTGMKVVNYSHDNPGNRIDRIFLKATSNTSVGIGEQGLTLSWNRVF
jgi:membrane-associated phospholipid phosphatase